MPPEQDPTTNLEKGIYYEAAKRRYRVRLYRNNCTHFGGYFKKYATALRAWEKLRSKLRTIRKHARNERPVHTLHLPDLHGIKTALKETQFRNPNALRIAPKK